MDSIIQKFYSNGNRTNGYSQFGAFSTNMITNKRRLPFNPYPYQINESNKPIKPIFTKINPQKSYNTIASNRYNKTKEEEFLYPQDLVFNSSSDLLYNNVQRIPRTEFYLVKQNLIAENKKNMTKMQMIEEKLRNLELKNQRLEVINDFFFDMFENSLIQEELRLQRDKNAQREENKIYFDDDGYKRKRKKFHKSKSDINLEKYNYYDLQNKFDAMAFQQKTTQDARHILDNIKKNIGNYMIEEEFKKNNQIQDITEGINDLKSDLTNKLDKMQKNQKMQMQKIAYCLLNSGDPKIESLATRLFNSHISDSKDSDKMLNEGKTLYSLYSKNDNNNNNNDNY